jgi:UDP-N-acetylmuramate dehydrogenase
MRTPAAPVTGVVLAGRTTMGVGGPARGWLDAHDDEELLQGLEWAHARTLAVTALGGGSNVVCADRGIEALVLRPRHAGLAATVSGGEATVEAGAGVGWDSLVGWTVARGYAGLECLSGIPGDVGAAPIQNLGAYGQEVADSVVAVRVIDRATGGSARLGAAECRFGYRDSIFKAEAAGRWLVVGVTFRLRVGGEPLVRYPELEQALAASHTGPTLGAVRDAVIALRRSKSLLLDERDPNGQSAGSFFVNPVVPAPLADEVAERARRLGATEPLPRHPAGAELVKLPAAWLIERAGLGRGTRRGRVGLSTRHALAIVNLGGATAAEVLAFAIEIRARVGEVFGVALAVEPQLLGFTPEELGPLE